jgi:hypothetical protein
VNTALITCCLLAAWIGPAVKPKCDAPPPEPDGSSLLEIRRVYVDQLGGGETAAQIRDLIISALQATKLFVITENEERADAILRGSAEDLVYTDKFNSSDGLSARANAGTGRSASGSTVRGSRTVGLSVSDHESTNIEERKHEAMATVRLVNRDGDVIWSTTQESTGGKFRGASADVAERVAKQLAIEFERERKARRLQ